MAEMAHLAAKKPISMCCAEAMHFLEHYLLSIWEEAFGSRHPQAAILFFPIESLGWPEPYLTTDLRRQNFKDSIHCSKWNCDFNS